VCYNELLPIYFPATPDPEFAARYLPKKQAYVSSPESSSTEEEEEDEDDDEDEDEEVVIITPPAPDPAKVDLSQKDSAPPLLFGKAVIEGGKQEVVVTLNPNGFQSRWPVVHYMLTPRGSYSTLYVKTELKDRQFTVASNEVVAAGQSAHFDWFLHGSE